MNTHARRHHPRTVAGVVSLRRWISARGRRLAALLLFAVGASSLPAQEFRAAWVDIFHAGMSSRSEVDTLVSTLASGNYNAVIVQVLGYMDMNGSASHGAHWQSNILPWSPRVKADFDPLAYLCTQAHAAGIEVHAWIGGSGGAMYRVSLPPPNGVFPPAGNATLAAHPEWFIAPRANSEEGTPLPVDGYYCLDMGSPDVQEYLVSIVRELVTNYPIDGINWDDEINGAGYTAGFGYPALSHARSGLARFRLNTGYVGTPSNTNTNWANYRRRFKNELMARVQAEIQSIKSNPRQPLRHTSAALAYSPVPGSCDFTTSTPYLYFCDWAGMLHNGWVDAVIPQTYSKSTFKSWADRITSCWISVRPVFMGISFSGLDIPTMTDEISYLRDKGLKGYATYSYFTAPANWWSYAAGNLNTNVVSTPPMPWRNPATATEGMMWGRVKDGATGQYVDDATVSITGGPTVRTDGNGYYVATLIPATAGGTPYVATATKKGAGSLTIANAVVLAGDVVRYDFTLVLPPPPPVSTWGDNTFGQCNTPATVTNAIAVAAGAWHTLALRADGIVVAWQDDSYGQCAVPDSLNSALAIAAGGYHSLAIRTDGQVLAWGANDYGQTNVPADLDNVLAIAAGTWHSVALRTDGTVVAWGDNSFGQTKQPAGLSDVVAIAAGGNHTLALRANGTVVAWGENTDAEGRLAGQSVVPLGLANVVAIAAGEYHSLAVKADGTVTSWGDNSRGQCDVPAGLADVVAVAGGAAHSLALTTNGTVVAWGANWSGQAAVSSGLPPAANIAAGAYHTVVLMQGYLPVPLLLNPARDGTRFSTLVQTLVRKSYALQYKESLTATTWTDVCTRPGNGGLQILTDPAATGTQRYYRMRQW
ncbi:MAG TPA: family 10 glycosylhydrolase [Verrucomicrobiota bacterium]|nr:family 10 glycosylhydrolase [Verrucomicrobiota bacterium]